MAKMRTHIKELDPVWEQIKREAQDTLTDEPLLGGVVHSSILHHRSLESALRIASR